MGGGSSIIITGPGDTIIYESIEEDTITGRLMTDVLDTRTFTLGYAILTLDAQIQPDILEHELGHVTQYATLGPFFLPLYGIDSLRAGGDWDRKLMEGPLLPNWPRRLP